MSSEQHRTPRIAVDLPARYRSGNVSLDGRAVDLSQDGMFFVTPLLDDHLGEINLELDLPDSDVPLRLTGEVRWIGGHDALAAHSATLAAPTSTLADPPALDDAPHSGMGIRFLKLSLSERLRLANFMIHRTYRAL